MSHERAFRLLLRVCPREFRARFGDEMTELFLTRIQRARARGGTMAMVDAWVRMGGDVLAAGLAERLGMNLDEGWDPLESTCRHASLSIL